MTDPMVQEVTEALEEERWRLPAPIGLESWDVVERHSALNRAQTHFRRPFEPPAVRWKVQSAGDGYGIVVAYIDARLVIERLNLVVGAGWEDEYAARGQGVEECALSVFGVTRRDVGKGQGFETEKSARSDALKRAGVKFGIGVSIYALKSVMLSATTAKQPDGDKLLTHLKKHEKGGKTTWSARISPAAEARLSAGYAKWLETERGSLFGPPLGHGDEEGAQGLEGDVPVASSEGAEPEPEPQGGRAGGPQIEGERADELRAQADALHAAIKEMNPGQIPPAKHKADLRKAGSESLESLAAYVLKLQQLKTKMEGARA
jgi:hypothetical protein